MLRGAASVRVNVRLSVFVLSDLISNGATVGVVMPGRPEKLTVYRSVLFPTLRTVRVTVCVPAMSPIVIDARFRSLGSSGPPMLAHADAGS